MSQKINSKVLRTASTYNPALDKFENVDVFPKKTALIEKKFAGRNLRAELAKVDEEKITKQ